MSKTIQAFNKQKECHRLDFDKRLIFNMYLKQADAGGGLLWVRDGATVQLLPGDDDELTVKTQSKEINLTAY
jgi:hypothetical protein